MDKLRISFKFLENVILHYDTDNEPVYGDIVEVVVNEQMFRESFKVSKLGRYPIGYERERAWLLGRALQSIGKNIENQAEHGKPMTRNINGEKQVFF
jgi:hypothetical protein